MKTIKKMINGSALLGILPMLLLFSSCKKYLDVKPNISLEVPSSIPDLQALLDNDNIMNVSDPGVPETAADNYYTPFTGYQASRQVNRATYVWDTKTNSTLNAPDWAKAYQSIEIANTVLDNLANLNATTNGYNTVKGSALFFRGSMFYNLAQVFAPPYNSTNASSPNGICVRLTSSVTTPSVRASVQQSYDQILQDLKQAVRLLQPISSFPTRPTKTAAYGMLARVYLSMNDYTNAGLYADSCLQLNNKLMDYNAFIPSSPSTFNLFNNEVIFHSESNISDIATRRGATVDSNLYKSYSDNDLRKTLFYDVRGSFIGSYSGPDYYYFDGIATDEMYLTRAECFARNGSTQSAISDLNTLMATRFKTGTFSAFTAATAQAALQLVLTERRKELVYRNIRWMDLRRLNQDPATAVTLTRNLNGTVYTLAPNDIHYTFLIPQNVINVTHFQNNPY